MPFPMRSTIPLTKMTVASLQDEHNDGEVAGLNLETGGPMEPELEGVFDSFRVLRNCMAIIGMTTNAVGATIKPRRGSSITPNNVVTSRNSSPKEERAKAARALTKSQSHRLVLERSNSQAWTILTCTHLL